tara:strand:+ start:184 stop:672 length:489 start_codon:yes stop_codon:yes gene_type:complete
MKSYARFKKDLTEAVPLAAPLLAPLVPKIVGGAAAAVGLGGMIHQATKQGQGGRSQPADYGQGGTAKPRGKNVQRPTGKQPKASYRDRMRAQQRQKAKEAQPERQAALEKEIDREIRDTMGTAADRAAAAAARANPATQRSAALKRTIADRMARGAKQNKLD